MKTARWLRGTDRPPSRRRKLTRIALRTGQALAALLVAGSVAFGMLLLVTPSAATPGSWPAR